MMIKSDKLLIMKYNRQTQLIIISKINLNKLLKYFTKISYESYNLII